MNHTQERLVAFLDAKFGSDYPQASQALRQIVDRWNKTPSRNYYQSRWVNEYGEGIDNGSYPGSEITGTHTDDTWEPITNRFYFQKERDWTHLAVEVDASPRIIGAPTGGYPVRTTIEIVLMLTFPGDFRTQLDLDNFSPGYTLFRGFVTFGSTNRHEWVHGFQLCREFPRDPANVDSEVTGIFEAPSRLPAGRYGAEVWAKVNATDSETLEINRVTCTVQEVPPALPVDDGEVLI